MFIYLFKGKGINEPLIKLLETFDSCIAMTKYVDFDKIATFEKQLFSKFERHFENL